MTDPDNEDTARHEALAEALREVEKDLPPTKEGK